MRRTETLRAFLFIALGSKLLICQQENHLITTFVGFSSVFVNVSKSKVVHLDALYIFTSCYVSFSPHERAWRRLLHQSSLGRCAPPAPPASGLSHPEQCAPSPARPPLHQRRPSCPPLLPVQGCAAQDSEKPSQPQPRRLLERDRVTGVWKSNAPWGSSDTPPDFAN